MNLLLKNLTWMEDETLRRGDVRIGGRKILEIGDNLANKKSDKLIHFDNHYLYRGLINSHDHLEMNLYPRMGKPPYKNYTEWARDIYKPNESPVKEIESIPIKYRLLWGGIKNLISGVTTVVHHNPWRYSLGYHFPVNVLKKYSWAHSIAFEKKLEKKFSFRKNTPFIIHAAEGTDSLARDEIKQLKDLGLLKPNTVLIHAVAIQEYEIDLIAAARASIVWCPSSNYFMFNSTTDIASIRKKIPVGLGSDSTMTGPATFLEEMQRAKNSGLVSAKEIFEMSTVSAEKIFNLPQQKIFQGSSADILIASIKTEDYYENLILQKASSLSAVMVKGEFSYADQSIAKELSLKGFFHRVGGNAKWFGFDIARLKKNIQSNGINDSFFDGNGLWQLLS